MLHKWPLRLNAWVAVGAAIPKLGTLGTQVSSVICGTLLGVKDASLCKRPYLVDGGEVGWNRLRWRRRTVEGDTVGAAVGMRERVGETGLSRSGVRDSASVGGV